MVVINSSEDVSFSHQKLHISPATEEGKHKAAKYTNSATQHALNLFHSERVAQLLNHCIDT